MLLQIDKLKRRPRQIAVDDQAESFPLLRELVDQGVVVFEDSIVGTLEASWVGKIVQVHGSLATNITSPCSRCLKPVAEQLNIPVSLSYTVTDESQDAPVAADVELESEDLSLIPFVGDEVDLQPDVEQEIIMVLPQQPLCQGACQGLCPVCGVNLNVGNCNCEPPVFHAGLAALKNFKVK